MKQDKLISQLMEQEEQLKFSSFDHDRAIEVGMAIYRTAKERELSVTIDVSAFGQTIFHVALPGTAPDNDRWIDRKRAVVHRMQKSSYRVGRELASEGLSIEERYFVSGMEFSPHGGCFPVRLEGSSGVIGTVTVSGLTQEEDHQLVVSVLEQLLKQ
ncbi:MAG: heme-degrading domain-containing protein [Alkalispirochaeta sp.]